MPRPGFWRTEPQPGDGWALALGLVVGAAHAVLSWGLVRGHPERAELVTTIAGGGGGVALAVMALGGLYAMLTDRSPFFAPTVPALGEVIPGFDFAPNIGIFAPAKTPAAIVNRLADEVAKLVKEADVIQTFTTAGIEGIGGSPADYARVLEREAERDAKAVKAAGVKIE